MEQQTTENPLADRHMCHHLISDKKWHCSAVVETLCNKSGRAVAYPLVGIDNYPHTSHHKLKLFPGELYT